MIDLAREKPITLGQAARQLGKSLETLHNWRRAGIIEAVKLGGWWHTTQSAIEQMAERLTDREERIEQAIKPRRRVASKQHEEAMKYLRSVGVA